MLGFPTPGVETAGPEKVVQRVLQYTRMSPTVGMATFAGLLVFILGFLLFPPQPGPARLYFLLIGGAVLSLSFLLLPLSIAIAILRYRLWDIDVFINRTLVYSALTAGVVGTYVLVVGALGALFQARGSLLISLFATGLVAVLFQPLRERLQRGVNRLMYGDRDDPYAVLSRLGERLEAALAPEGALPAIAETVAGALKLPYAAIALKQRDEFRVVAEYAPTPSPSEEEGRGGGAPSPSQGEGRGGGQTIPLIYQSEPVGQLIVAPRAPGEDFTPEDRRLLEDIARQAGTVAHAVRLTADLQRSRERLVTAREEERRRLRRDLHDGLGPQLASLTLKLDAVRNLLAHDSAAADELVVELKAQVQAAIADIRRLVYALRPPALDELGLVGALREHAVSHSTGDGLRISVEAPEKLPPLPAAVEVAAYRIALEAITNVARHAHAQQCVVRLTLDDALQLEITDDGMGLPAGYHAGVGLASMRERAAELGGSCVVEARPEGGTRVLAELPVSRKT